MRTGYALANEDTAFTYSGFLNRFPEYLTALGFNGLGIFFPLGIVGILGLCKADRTRHLGVTLLVGAVALLVVYSAYYWGLKIRGGGAWGGLRFLLPVYPSFILGGVWGLCSLASRLGRGVVVGMAVVVTALQMLWQEGRLLPDTKLLQERQLLADAEAFVRRHVPAGEVVVGPAGLLRQLEYSGAWKLVAAERLDNGCASTKKRKAEKANHPRTEAVFRARGRKEEWQERAYAGLDRESRLIAVLWEIRRWAGKGGGVHVLGTARDFRRWMKKEAWWVPPSCYAEKVSPSKEQSKADETVLYLARWPDDFPGLQGKAN